jgi:hypothetical protein
VVGLQSPSGSGSCTPEVILGQLEVILGQLEVILGQLEVILGQLEVILGQTECKRRVTTGVQRPI